MNILKNNKDSKGRLYLVAGMAVLLVAVAMVWIFWGGANRAQLAAVSPSSITTVAQSSAPAVVSSEAPKPQPVEITLRMVGDALYHEPVMQSGLKPDGTYQFDHLFAQIKEDIVAADIALINQETLLGGTEMGLTGYPCFNSPQEAGDALVANGFDVIQHANNHAMDKGKKGLDRTLSFWQEKYPQMVYVGINQSAEEAGQIRVVEKKGIKIAFLSYTTSLNGIALPTDRPWAVDLLQSEKVTAQIQEARLLADFVVVLPHWGEEYQYKPSAHQVNTAKAMADAGADLIIGTHPHVLQPVEWVDNARGGQTLVYYSLGNFVSNQSRPPRMLGGMANVTLVVDESGVAIQTAELVPLVTHYEWGNLAASYTVYKLADYTDELAKRHGVLRAETTDDGAPIPKEFSLIYLEKLTREILGEWTCTLQAPPSTISQSPAEESLPVATEKSAVEATAA